MKSRVTLREFRLPGVCRPQKTWWSSWWNPIGEIQSYFKMCSKDKVEKPCENLQNKTFDFVFYFVGLYFEIPLPSIVSWLNWFFQWMALFLTNAVSERHPCWHRAHPRRPSRKILVKIIGLVKIHGQNGHNSYGFLAILSSTIWSNWWVGQKRKPSLWPQYIWYLYNSIYIYTYTYIHT